jgi:hypothetical protein
VAGFGRQFGISRGIHAVPQSHAGYYTGCYAELPDQCVLKIDHGNEVKNIRIALERLFGDSGLWEELASRAGVWAKKTFRGAIMRSKVEMGGQSYKTRSLAHCALF